MEIGHAPSTALAALRHGGRPHRATRPDRATPRARHAAPSRVASVGAAHLRRRMARPRSHGLGAGHPTTLTRRPAGTKPPWPRRRRHQTPTPHRPIGATQKCPAVLRDSFVPDGTALADSLDNPPL